jgi:flagellar capping protein FliD
MSSFSPIGLRLFDAPNASNLRTSTAQRPLDGLHALAQALAGTNARRQNDVTLPDFVGAATAALSAVRATTTGSPSGAFSLTRDNDTADPVRVTSVATAAHARSQGFTSADDEVTAGHLGFSINGTSYGLDIAQGSKLKDVVAGLRALGAPIDASIESNGSQVTVGIKARNTGYALGGTASDALTITESDSGTTGRLLGLAVDQQATNAVFTLHGVTRTSTDNRITDTISGATFDLANPPSATNASAGIDRIGTLSRPGDAGGSTGALVAVDSLARPAEVQSEQFVSAQASVTSGSLSLNVEGKRYDVAIKDGDTLADVRRNVENSGANVKAAIVTDGGGVRLSIASRAAGYPVQGRPEDALNVTEASTGSSGQSLRPAVTQAASNAAVTVDGKTTTSRSNTITGAIPGFTLDARHVSASPEVVALPGVGLRPPLNVENELNRVLQAQLLKPRDLGLGDTADSGKDDAKRADEINKPSPTRQQPSGGTESSRRDILQKLTAVDNVQGGLRAAQDLLGAQGSAASSPA